MPPSTVVNGTQSFAPPGVALEDLLAKPFHIYDDAFYAVIGQDPTLTLIAEQASDPLYHEAVVWFVSSFILLSIRSECGRAHGD